MVFSRILPILFALALPMAVRAVPPVFEGVPATGVVTQVQPRIPAGKSVLVPLSAIAEDGGPVTYTVTSSNPKVFARIRSGHPLLRIKVDHNYDGAAVEGDPKFEGEVAVQLFRDWAPMASDYIGGFAQGGFYDEYTGHTGVIFHRILDLNNADEANPTQPSSYIFQGGDPLGTGSGGPGFTFDNEFNVAALFSGRGQLAMANANYNEETYKGTNGSQFFLTESTLRPLDFDHTIFGQITHGWVRETASTTPLPSDSADWGALLAKMKAVPRDEDGKPKKTLKIISSGVSAQYTYTYTENEVQKSHTYSDALLLLSSSALGTSTITITAKDSKGQTATRTFEAVAYQDTNNDRPFLEPLDNKVVAKNAQANIPFRVVDLERDYVSLGQGLLENTNGGSTAVVANIKGGSGFTKSNVLSIAPNPKYKTSATATTAAPYTGPLKGVISAQQFDPARRSVDGSHATDDFRTVTVAVGDKTVETEAVHVLAKPATAYTGVVARFRDTDVQGQAATYTALINWGDGFASAQAGVISTDTSKPGLGRFQVVGSHTYLRAGFYPVVVTLTSSLGQEEMIRSFAVVTSDTLAVTVPELAIAASKVNNREIARFTDTSSPAAATGYEVSIDWGDGLVERPASVRPLGAGVFAVYGTHVYKDCEKYALVVRVRKTATGQKALGYGRLELSGFTGPKYLPPYDQAHLAAEISAVPVDKKNPASAAKPTKESEIIAGVSQTYLNYSITIVNSGNKPSKAGTLYMLLSDDLVPNLTDVKDGVGNVVRKADIQLEYGPFISKTTTRRKTTAIKPLAANSAVTYTFTKSSLGDFRLRLPRGETGTGLNVLAFMVYGDATAALLPIDRVGAEGPITGIYLSKRVLGTSEVGTTDSFSVTLDRRPTADVSISLAQVSVFQNGILLQDNTEGTLDRDVLVFTPDDWNVPHTVTVTGKSDSALPTGDGTTSTVDGLADYAIRLAPAVSADPRYNGLSAQLVTYRGAVGAFVVVTNEDIDGNIAISPTNAASSSLTTKEADGTGHTDSFRIQLTRIPTSPVSVEIHLSNTAEGEIILPGETVPESGDTAVVTFDPAATNGLAAKTITVRGKKDNTDDGDKTYAISFIATSNDPQFDQITPRPLSVKNVDEDPVTPTTPTP